MHMSKIAYRRAKHAEEQAWVMGVERGRMRAHMVSAYYKGDTHRYR